jgi:hypothetical protein
MTRLALAALFALPLAGAGATTTAVAGTVNGIDFVCFDVVQDDGTTEVECEDATLVADQCEKSDPDAESSECKAVQEFRPQREWVVPASLTEGGDNTSVPTPGGKPAGGGFKGPMTEAN